MNNERDLVFKILNKRDFKQWLESLSDDWIVGPSCDSTSCAIARYLDAKIGIPVQVQAGAIVSIRVGKVLFSRLDAEFDWVWKFISLFDSFDGVYVRKEQCLEMLEKV